MSYNLYHRLNFVPVCSKCSMSYNLELGVMNCSVWVSSLPGRRVAVKVSQVRKLPLVSSEIAGVRHWCMPREAECVTMLRELVQRFGQFDTAALLGVPCLTLGAWLGGKCSVSAARRVIWLHWALLLHPEHCQTAFDLITWGRFRVEKSHKSPGWEWSDWSI